MRVVAGVDEVGRGSLIGPVFAAAVILDRNINRKLLKDSKGLSKAKREVLSKYIKNQLRLYYIFRNKDIIIFESFFSLNLAISLVCS